MLVAKCTYKDFHVVVQPIVDHHMMSHGEPVGLHGMLVAIVDGSNITYEIRHTVGLRRSSGSVLKF